MHMETEFNCLDRLIVGTDLNLTAARDHVPEIESQIQVIKERMRAVYDGLPYDRMTIHMIIELGKYLVNMINAFPKKSSISRTYSPRTIITGKQLDLNKQCRCPFGAYIQAHDDRNVTSQMLDWTQCAICLGPTVNL